MNLSQLILFYILYLLYIRMIIKTKSVERLVKQTTHNASQQTSQLNIKFNDQKQNKFWFVQIS
jgi:hypothetical protein